MQQVRTVKKEKEYGMAFYQLDFYSKILARKTDVLLATPDTTEDNSRVVYLLHGGGGGGGTDNKSWLAQKQRLCQWAEKYKTVFVMPSAPDSFFANTCRGVRYQDYMLEELVVQMPELLRISKERMCTAVAGMSMGGTSAFRLGMAAPERFGVIGCLCSGNLWMSPLSNKVHAYAVKKVFGVEKIQDIAGSQYDFFVDTLRNVQENRPLPYVFHACGKQDHALEHAHATAEWFRQHAPEYSYTYFEPEDGKHDDEFFSKWMLRFLDFFTSCKE